MKTSPAPQFKIDTSALILVDIQRGFDTHYLGNRNNPNAEDHAASLLEFWRSHDGHIFHIQHISLIPHSPLRKGQPGCEHKPQVQPLPSEPIVQKSVNSAFIGTDLEKRLRRLKQHTVVIAGLTTPHCVSTTARMASNLGFNTFTISDACAAFEQTGPNGEKYNAELVHNLALASLHGEFGNVIYTKDILHG